MKPWSVAGLKNDTMRVEMCKDVCIAKGLRRQTCCAVQTYLTYMPSSWKNKPAHRRGEKSAMQLA